jgi:hypothetical protein
MDEAVDQVMARSTSEEGAGRSSSLRKSQQKERVRIAQDITAAQQKIATLTEERAPIAAEVRKVEAEVGPIKYIASLIYGDNPDSNLLERAVTWVTILIVIILDPLAIVLLLASQYSFQRFRLLEEGSSKSPEEISDEILDFFEQAKTTAQEIDAGTYVAPHETSTDNPIDFPKNIDQLPKETVDFIFPHANEGQSSLVESLPGAPDSVEDSTTTKPDLPPGHVAITKALTRIGSRTKVFPSEDYVQNEEQNESNLWTSSTAMPVSISQQEYNARSQEILKGDK